MVLLVILAWQLGWFSGADDREQDLTLLSGAFTERTITDRQSALAAIGDVADLVGITNATAEFGSCQEDTAFDNTYYRFNQQYEGIPVYGRSMVVCADAAGNGLSLSGSYLPITGLDTAPDITAQEAIAIADSAYQMSAEITSEGLSIYSAGRAPGRAGLEALCQYRHQCRILLCLCRGWRYSGRLMTALMLQQLLARVLISMELDQTFNTDHRWR